MTARRLIALDIDGTVLLEDGEIRPRVIEQVHRVRDAGHEVMLATGRSPAMTLPVLERLELASAYVVSSNGAITLRRDSSGITGYVRHRVETFEPGEVLTRVREHLAEANFAVEDETGVYHFTGWFPNGSLGAVSQQVDFESLLHLVATRVVVLSPGHDVDDFLAAVQRMGLRQVSYNVGWTAWLDIAPEGVNKSTALEAVRRELGVPRDRVMAIGDGRNDIDMLAWAAAEGLGVAMGQSPPEVRAVANEFTGTGYDDGVATALERLVP